MCPYCVMAKEYFKDEGFEFEALDVSSDPKAMEELRSKTNALSVPVIDIDGEMIIGFDRKRIDKLLEIKG